MNDENLARQDALRRRFYIRDPYVPRERRHKFAIGEVVQLIPSSGVKRPRLVERDALGERFEITRLLPQEDRSFQYRIKDVATGHERVVAEESIVAKD